MKLRFVLFLLVAVACTVFNGVLDVVLPTIDAQVAVDQLSDSEAAANMMRGLSRFEGSIPLVTWASVCVFGILLFTKELTNVVKSIFN